MTDKKKFGLVMPKKTDAFKVKKNSIFNGDSDEETVHKRPKIPQKKIELKTELMEDPTIYEYDDIYDEMKRKQTETIVLKEKKNSRYIETLMKAAEKRKKEYERRIDKKIQDEREQEGDKYKDKEAFVTSSYKRKMQEQEEEEEKERRENMLNDMMDVTKQKDLSGFYRHFLKQTVGEEKVPAFGREIKKEIMSDEDASQKQSGSFENIDQDSDNVEIDDSESQESAEKSDTEKQRRKTSSCSENERCKSFLRSRKRSRANYKKSKSDSNSNSSSGDEENELPIKKTIHTDKHKNSKKHSRTNMYNSRHDSYSSSADDNIEPKEKVDDNVDCNKNANSEKRRINIFARRTIGDIFAEAQARYFQRMASREK